MARLFARDYSARRRRLDEDEHRLSDEQHALFSAGGCSSEPVTQHAVVVFFAHGAPHDAGDEGYGQVMRSVADWIAGYGRNGTEYYLWMCFSASTLGPALLATLERLGHSESRVHSARGVVSGTPIRTLRSGRWSISA